MEKVTETATVGALAVMANNGRLHFRGFTRAGHWPVRVIETRGRFAVRTAFRTVAIFDHLLDAREFAFSETYHDNDYRALHARPPENGATYGREPWERLETNSRRHNGKEYDYGPIFVRG